MKSQIVLKFNLFDATKIAPEKNNNKKIQTVEIG